MTERSEQNQNFLDTLFLDGGNAAYLEQMQAKYAENPNSVDASFRAYFASLGEDSANAKKNAEGPVWKRDAHVSDPTPDLTSALTGDWGNTEAKAEKVKAARPSMSDSEAEQAAKDSLHALMLIRAYRARGHLIADLDPLGLQKPEPHPELEPSTYSFGPEDMDREIFIDGVLGLETATLSEILDILKRTYDDFGSGDVKYHLGVSDDREFDGNNVHLSLAPNPSHLEVVAPVVMGKTRAKQQMASGTYQSHNPEEVMAVILHGDSAFAGQGVVMESFQLSQLIGYRTGGTIHVVVNNQIGFTTTPDEYRSGQYCSDVAFMVEAPVFHVNGDDPEAVVFAARVATEYRQKFGKDVVLDIICYRRYGHNEGDDPSFTQPIMYQAIGNRPSTRKIYADRLIAQGDLTEAEAKEIGEKIVKVPNSLNMHRTLKRIIKARADKVSQGANIDWGLAEHLAFGTLITEGHPVRLSGQDSERGTFSQRQSNWIDQKTEEKYCPLNTLSNDQEYYQVLNSHLSEEAVLGFEYGFSAVNPNALTIWEAQFGDFANGAQVMVDQFISSAEQKWLRMSGLVMLLPHGYEGQGPEHSSARLERYLQMCAEDNMQVTNISTPANYFHALRRQVKRKFRKPLINMSPKSLLRHKLCVSTFEEMGPGSEFHRLLWDDAEYNPSVTQIKLAADSKIKRVIICSGKVYYDLFEEREKNGRNDIYLKSRRIWALGPSLILSSRKV